MHKYGWMLENCLKLLSLWNWYVLGFFVLLGFTSVYTFLCAVMSYLFRCRLLGPEPVRRTANMKIYIMVNQHGDQEFSGRCGEYL